MFLLIKCIIADKMLSRSDVVDFHVITGNAVFTDSTSADCSTEMVKAFQQQACFQSLLSKSALCRLTFLPVTHLLVGLCMLTHTYKPVEMCD